MKALLLLALLCALPASAAMITTSTCSIDAIDAPAAYQETVTGPDPCRLELTHNGMPVAMAQIWFLHFSAQVSESRYVIFDGFIQSGAWADGFYVSSYALIDLAYEGYIVTPGPERPGIMTISGAGSAWNGTLAVSIGELTQTHYEGWMNFPVTLGTTIPVSIFGRALAYYHSMNGAEVRFTYDLAFNELDGSTVAPTLVDIPEPSALWLSALGTLALLKLQRHRRTVGSTATQPS